jgi:hypothetical protein
MVRPAEALKMLEQYDLQAMGQSADLNGWHCWLIVHVIDTMDEDYRPQAGQRRGYSGGTEPKRLRGDAACLEDYARE